MAIAQAFLPSEDAATMKWAFGQLKEMLLERVRGILPCTFLTDADAAASLAIAAVFPAARQFRCSWHLLQVSSFSSQFYVLAKFCGRTYRYHPFGHPQNVIKNCRGSFSGNKEGWSRFLHRFHLASVAATEPLFFAAWERVKEVRHQPVPAVVAMSHVQ